MSERYSYKDVIIDPEDPRVEVGAEYFFSRQPQSVLRDAIHGYYPRRLVRVDDEEIFPFFVDRFNGYSCLIRKKEPEKKHVPFDLSKPEVREDLRGRWIRRVDGKAETMVWGFWLNSGGDVIVNRNLSAEDLVKNWAFEDGSPCGEEVLE